MKHNSKTSVYSHRNHHNNSSALKAVRGSITLSVFNPLQTCPPRCGGQIAMAKQEASQKKDGASQKTEFEISHPKPVSSIVCWLLGIRSPAHTHLGTKKCTRTHKFIHTQARARAHKFIHTITIARTLAGITFSATRTVSHPLPLKIAERRTIHCRIFVTK